MVTCLTLAPRAQSKGTYICTLYSKYFGWNQVTNPGTYICNSLVYASYAYGRTSPKYERDYVLYIHHHTNYICTNDTDAKSFVLPRLSIRRIPLTSTLITMLRHKQDCGYLSRLDCPSMEHVASEIGQASWWRREWPDTPNSM